MTAVLASKHAKTQSCATEIYVGEVAEFGEEDCGVNIWTLQAVVFVSERFSLHRPSQ